MKKFFKALLICLILLPCMLLMISCNGMSAYEIAVKNGYIGTETQWLESLKNQDTPTSITIKDIYDAAVEEGFEGDFLEFLKEYLSFDSSQSLVDEASNKAMLSVVSIFCMFTDSQSGEEYMSAGSGVIYQLDKENGDAYIITNFHVVYEKDSDTLNKISDDVMVLLYGQEFEDYAIEATYLGGSMTYDIAVLEVSDSDVLKQSSAQQAEIADFYDLSLGQTTIALGNALGEGLCVTSGVLGVDSEYITMIAPDGETIVDYRVMRIDSAVNGGNSGGGLFNIAGELIGIVNAKVVSEEVENVGYAIPVSIAVGVVQNIIDNNSATVQRPKIGINIQLIESKSIYDSTVKRIIIEQAMQINSIELFSLAAVSGLHIEDILQSVTIDSKVYNLTRLFYLSDLLLTCRENDSITLTVLRKNGLIYEEMDITLTFNAATIITVD